MSSGTNSLDADEAQQQQPPQPEPQPLQPLSLEDVVDDFSLLSHGVRFRAGREMRIYNQAHGQLILEERSAFDSDDEGGEEQAPQDKSGRAKEGKGAHRILVKTVNDNNKGVSFLRAAYSLMTVFVGGFLFILGAAIILFLFIDLGTKVGLGGEGREAQPVAFVAVLLSLPMFVYGLAFAMTLMGIFVVDTFYGHPFLRSFGMGAVMTDWLAFIMYLGIPILTVIITLLDKKDNWWEISLLTSFASILIFWCFFAACEFWFEIWACLELMEEYDGTSLIDEDPMGARVKFWLTKAANACRHSLEYRLSGKRVVFTRMNDTNGVTAASNTFIDCINNTSFSRWLANKGWNPFYVQKEAPERIASLNEVMGNTHYVTRFNWSLEKLFCAKGGLHSAIPITQGDSSITKAQINSNIVCNIVGNLIIVLILAGAIVWFELTSLSTAVGIVAFICFIHVSIAVYRMWILRNDIINDENTGTLYSFWGLYQQTTPKPRFGWAVLFAQLVFFYILPLIYLAAENMPHAILFALLGFFAFLRHHLNPRILLMEKKNYFQDTVNVKTREERKKWKKKSRMYHIVAVGGDTARHFWTWAFLLFTIFCFVVLIVAIGERSDDTYENNEPSVNSAMTLIEGYSYQPRPSLPYPTCQLKKGLDGDAIDLADFAFLSGLAYKSNVTLVQGALDLWFGEGVATNNVALVDEFRSSPGYGFDYGTAVSYKLITFSDNSGVLTIRGTQTTWDLIADAQLWLSAALFQGLRFLLPFSELFTPILHKMVWMVTRLESESITKVAYYQETQAFVKYLKDVKKFETVEVTGHSLGGGLAIITGAESGTSAVAISGPNAKLSRDSFDPPVTVDQLDTYTFNVIPARDPIPMIDDKAWLYQNINCTAAANNFVGCHAIARSICEIQYTCGSGNGPILCECVLDYNYTEPSPINEAATAETQVSFVQQCIDICEKQGGGNSKNCARWKEEYGQTAAK
mmetsp:Transcript_13321/g.28260  ORF Transcript_13321/g.28260 Transcript_13321/m.28260 type:complete len:973 (+) Transcript_13321:182-3100(+)